MTVLCMITSEQGNAIGQPGADIGFVHGPRQYPIEVATLRTPCTTKWAPPPVKNSTCAPAKYNNTSEINRIDSIDKLSDLRTAPKSVRACWTIVDYLVKGIYIMQNTMGVGGIIAGGKKEYKDLGGKKKI